MKKYMTVYHANLVDYDATVKKALELGIVVKLGGGRSTKGGEPPNAQITLKLEKISSKILIARNGRIIIYYPSLPNLGKCIEVLERCYVPKDGKFNLTCEGPVDPLDRSIKWTMKINWEGSGITYVEAKIDVCQWLDLKTGEYVFRLPDQKNQVFQPQPETDYIYQGSCPVTVAAIDKDDEKGNRIITAEKLVWKGIQELRRIAEEHPRLKLH